MFSKVILLVLNNIKNSSLLLQSVSLGTDPPYQQQSSNFLSPSRNWKFSQVSLSRQAKTHNNSNIFDWM